MIIKLVHDSDKQCMKQSVLQATAEAKRRRKLKHDAEKSREEQQLEKESVTYESGGFL